ncbi:MAG: hypothetical protein CL878_15505 [Dehalococcoidia bacterium]|nr:hypothetical protein [Dehalococcoidia bacterium]
MKLPHQRQVVLYSKADCHLCHEAKMKIERVRRRVGFQFQEVDITGDPELMAQYEWTVPVVSIDGRDALVSRVSEFRLLRALLG